jgi:hypothetical protein
MRDKERVVLIKREGGMTTTTTTGKCYNRESKSGSGSGQNIARAERRRFLLLPSWYGTVHVHKYRLLELGLGLGLELLGFIGLGEKVCWIFIYCG